MKKQILIIHGGTTYPSHKSFIDNLKTTKIDLDRLKYTLDWKNAIASDLGNDYEVLTPRMPNGTNAKYNEWKIWFENIVPFLNNNVVLVGHSLGGIFLAKYLSQNSIKKQIEAVVLVSAPFKGDNKEEYLGSFELPKSLAKFNSQAKDIILIHSKDDPVVPYGHVNMYKKHLSNSRIITFKTSGHFFQQEHFPELVKLISSL